MKNIVLILISLVLTSFISSAMLFVLLNRRLKFFQAFKLFNALAALNKLLLTGSGYAAAGFRLKKENFPLSLSISSLAALEIFSVLPWLLFGFYFGAASGVKFPVFFAIAFCVIALSAAYKAKALFARIKEIAGHFAEIRFGLLAVVPLGLLNVAVGTAYYFFLCRAFGVNLGTLDVLKASTVSFTIGYLSIFPSGIGIKEAGLVFLLVKNGALLSQAFSVALADRILATVFWGLAGAICGKGLFFHGCAKGTKKQARAPETPDKPRGAG